MYGSVRFMICHHRALETKMWEGLELAQRLTSFAANPNKPNWPQTAAAQSFARPVSAAPRSTFGSRCALWVSGFSNASVASACWHQDVTFSVKTEHL